MKTPRMIHYVFSPNQSWKPLQWSITSFHQTNHENPQNDPSCLFTKPTMKTPTMIYHVISSNQPWKPLEWSITSFHQTNHENTYNDLSRHFIQPTMKTLGVFHHVFSPYQQWTPLGCPVTSFQPNDSTNWLSCSMTYCSVFQGVASASWVPGEVNVVLVNATTAAVNASLIAALVA